MLLAAERSMFRKQCITESIGLSAKE